MKIGEEIVKWLMDVSKYVMTAIVISSFLTDLGETWMVYVFGSLVSGVCFGGGIWLAKKQKQANDNNNKNEK